MIHLYEDQSKSIKCIHKAHLKTRTVNLNAVQAVIQEQESPEKSNIKT